MPERTAHEDRRRLLVETAVAERGRGPQLVDRVVLLLVVLREPHLAAAREAVRVLVLRREIEARLQRRLREVRLERLRLAVDLVVVDVLELRALPRLRDRRAPEVVDEVAPDEARPRA